MAKSFKDVVQDSPSIIRFFRHPFARDFHSLRLEHQRDHRVRSELGTCSLTDGLPCHAPLCADEDCVLCIIHREIEVATHLVFLLKAPQVRVETAMP